MRNIVSIESVFFSLLPVKVYGDRIEDKMFDFVTANIVLTEKPSSVFCDLAIVTVNETKDKFFISEKIEPIFEKFANGTISKYKLTIKDFHQRLAVLYQTKKVIYFISGGIFCTLRSPSSFIPDIPISGGKYYFSLRQDHVKKKISSFSYQIIESVKGRKTYIRGQLTTTVRQSNNISPYNFITTGVMIKGYNIRHDRLRKYVMSYISMKDAIPFPLSYVQLGTISDNETEQNNNSQNSVESMQVFLTTAHKGSRISGVSNHLATMILVEKVFSVETYVCTLRRTKNVSDVKVPLATGKIGVWKNFHNVNNAVKDYYIQFTNYKKYEGIWREVFAYVSPINQNLVTANIPTKILSYFATINKFTTPSVENDQTIYPITEEFVIARSTVDIKVNNKIYSYFILAGQLRIGEFKYFHSMGLNREVYVNRNVSKLLKNSPTISLAQRFASFPLTVYPKLCSVRKGQVITKSISTSNNSKAVGYGGWTVSKDLHNSLVFSFPENVDFNIIRYGEFSIVLDFKKSGVPISHIAKTPYLERHIFNKPKNEIYKIIDKNLIDPDKYFYAMLRVNSAKYKNNATDLEKLINGQQYEEWRKNELLEYFQRDDISEAIKTLEEAPFCPFELFSIISKRVRRPSINIFDVLRNDDSSRFLVYNNTKALNPNRPISEKKAIIKIVKTRKVVSIPVSLFGSIWRSRCDLLNPSIVNKIISDGISKNTYKIQKTFFNKIIEVEATSNIFPFLSSNFIESTRGFQHTNNTNRTNIRIYNYFIEIGETSNIDGASSVYEKLLNMYYKDSSIHSYYSMMDSRYSNSDISGYSEECASMYYDRKIEKVEGISERLTKIKIVFFPKVSSVKEKLISIYIPSNKSTIHKKHEEAVFAKLFYERKSSRVIRTSSIVSMQKTSIDFFQSFEMEYKEELISKIEKESKKGKLSLFIQEKKNIAEMPFEGTYSKSNGTSTNICGIDKKPVLEQEGFDHIRDFNGKQIIGNYSDKTTELINSAGIKSSRIKQFKRDRTLINISEMSKTMRDIDIDDSNVQKLKDWDYDLFSITEKDLSGNSFRSKKANDKKNDAIMEALSSLDGLKEQMKKGIDMEKLKSNGTDIDLSKSYPSAPIGRRIDLEANPNPFLSIEEIEE